MRLSKMNFKGQKPTWAHALGHALQGGLDSAQFSMFVSGLRLVTKIRLLSLNDSDYGLSDFHSILIHAK